MCKTAFYINDKDQLRTQATQSKIKKMYSMFYSTGRGLQIVQHNTFIFFSPSSYMSKIFTANFF